MKLWEAMLEGAKAGPQLFGSLSDGNGGTCAMGAVMKGGGLEVLFHSIEVESSLVTRFPELHENAVCPEDACYICHGNVLLNVIVTLNDDHRWSRQRIAEWLANRELVFAESKTKEAKETTIKQEVVR